MAQPRFLLVAGTASARPGWAQWPDEPVAADEVATDGSWVAWRLAGGNNRELGRSAAVFADVSACRDAAVLLQRELVRTRRVAAVNDSTGLWGWRVELDGRPVAAAGRLYLRQRECHYSLTQFLAAVPNAKLVSHVVYLTRHGGRPESRVARPQDAPTRPVADRPPGEAAGPDDCPARLDRPPVDRSLAGRAMTGSM